MRNESQWFRFPSVSICPKFKKVGPDFKRNAHLIKDILQPEMQARNWTFFHEIDFRQLLGRRISSKRHDR